MSLGFAFGLAGRAGPRIPKPVAAASRLSRLPRGSGDGEAVGGSIAIGDEVEARSEEDGGWYPGTVAAKADGIFVVRWEDPDGGPETEEVKLEEMNPYFKDYKVDDVVDAIFPEDGQMYPGTVIAMNNDGTFQVKWDDPDGGPEDSACRPMNMKYPPIPLDKLEVGRTYRGKVVSIRDFGAFVDIGAEREGLLHISQISTERIESVGDHLEEGQMLDVWVLRVNDGRLGLSMIEGGATTSTSQDIAPFVGASPLDWLSGKVTRVTNFGAFVSVASPDGKATASGLVHISQLKDGFVESVEDEVEVDQEVEVRILAVDEERGQISLSMRQPGGSGDAGVGRPAADLSAFEGMSPETWLKGTVARTASFGAFVRVTAEGGEQADGLVHITQIRDGFVESVESELEAGQDVEVRVLAAENGKMSLSMKQPGDGAYAAPEPADLSAFEGVSPETWLKGTVATTASFGAFVTVTAEGGEQADGLVHITQIRDGFVESVESELELGQDVEVRVLSVQDGKMSLSMKQPGGEGEEEF